MQELIDTCAAVGFRQMIGYIDADNTASQAIHEKLLSETPNGGIRNSGFAAEGGTEGVEAYLETFYVTHMTE